MDTKLLFINLLNNSDQEIKTNKGEIKSTNFFFRMAFQLK